MVLGLRHPEMFASVGSHSGALGFGRNVAKILRAGEDPQTKYRRPPNIPNFLIGMPDFDSPSERTPKGDLFLTAEQADDHQAQRSPAELPARQTGH